MSSRVPQHSLHIGHATSTPDVEQTVNRFLLNLSRISCLNPVLASSHCISTHNQWFPFGHLLYSHLTANCRHVSLTTLSFEQSSIHWFATTSCKAIAEDQTSIYIVVTNVAAIPHSHGTRQSASIYI
ncbi:MAG: hypothetical protein LBQ60_20315 [Bacteroidales bacterium]|nr:hypothetical protein [Bacteroidales bacterium]